MRALKLASGIGAGLLIILILLLGALAIGSGSVLAWLLEHPVRGRRTWPSAAASRPRSRIRSPPAPAAAAG